DKQRTAPLARRLESEGVLKNPPIVTPLDGDTRYVVLDGANRTTALAALSCPCCLVQVVPYSDPPVTLSTWHHVIAGFSADDYLPALKSLDGLTLEPLDLLHARAGLARRELLAYTICSDGDAFAAYTDRRGLHEQNALLNRMVDTYKDRGRLYRAATDQLAD